MAKRVKGEWAPSIPYTHEAFRPYVTALGQLTLAWNDLHETLAILFCSVMGGGFANQFLAVWHALKSDRSQRDILSAAVSAGLVQGGPPQLLDDVTWICKQADALEDTRNTALHSPLWGSQWQSETRIQPLLGLGHVRAGRLAGKNLLVEFRWCRDAATVLRNFAMEIDVALSRGSAWPIRPTLPNRGHGQARPRQRPQAKVKNPSPG
jgi:hypothetical protein